MSIMLAVLILGVFLVVGLGVTGWGLMCMARSRRAVSWPTVPGHMNSCKIEESRSSRSSVQYSVEVDYSYRVLGQEYHGDRIAFGYTGNHNLEESKALHARLSQARLVDVSYNPSRPTESALAVGIDRSAVSIVVFGISWLVFIAGIASCWVLSEKRSDRDIIDRIGILEQIPPRDQGEIRSALDRSGPALKD